MSIVLNIEQSKSTPEPEYPALGDSGFYFFFPPTKRPLSGARAKAVWGSAYGFSRLVPWLLASWGYQGEMWPLSPFYGVLKFIVDMGNDEGHIFIGNIEFNLSFDKFP
jgi:hypothetical protein